MLQVSKVIEREALLAFQKGLKPWVKQELGLGKDKLGSSKSDERGVCEMDYKEDSVDSNGNCNNGGNTKPRVGKKKPKRKGTKLKCFLCDGPHMLKKCLRKYVLKEKPVGKALVTEVSEKVYHRGERWGRQEAQEAWFEQGKS
ncbi:hypothetical protein Goshw_011999 [Gossypium schwendimanii]|uniref:Uncharacterized protein n=1 Tax=Gossypium schwendimanii TaxID=34291 RepID=A0A7J9NB68_GOSSC|nr:hypothetical protein [Gossypium schwendimanii]